MRHVPTAYRALAAAIAAAALVLIAGSVAAQMVTAEGIDGFADTFGVVLDQRSYPYRVQLIESTIPGNVLWPGDKAKFTFQLTNHLDEPIQLAGRVDVIQYGTKGKPRDIWNPDMFKIADCGSVAIQVDLKPKGWQNVTIEPDIPATFGAYGLVVDLGKHGRQFAAGCVRTFQATPGRVRLPQLGSDVTHPAVLRRLGCKGIRYGVDYRPTTDKGFKEWFERHAAKLRAYYDANVSVIIEFGAGHAPQPLGRARPHLSDGDVMLGTKTDMAWLPEYDKDFQKVAKLFAATFGWPKGCVNGFMLWNEPWEGLSISGWGADMPRYREIYSAMCRGIEEARREAGVQVLLGGCDSSSNTFDKLFGDGSDGFLKWLDFCSIHYQGMHPPACVKKWVNRKPDRVLIWDTESWVANSDDRVAAVLATNMSTGHDRAVGIYHGNICTDQHSTRKQVFGPDGKKKTVHVVQAWSVAAAVGAAQHFIGERKFREMLFRNGLPWVMVFDGLPQDGKPNPEDGTVVVVGDIGDGFGHDSLLFRTARGLAEVAHKAELRKQLAALPADTPAEDRKELADAVREPETLSGATMALPSGTGALWWRTKFRLYDFYGNPVRPKGGKIVVPLDHRGFFLRSDGSKGSFEKLLAALRAARVDGIEPLATECLDLLAPIDKQPTLRLRLTNVLNRPVSGTLRLTLGKLQLQAPATLSFAANETRTVPVKVVGGKPTADNTYPLSLVFDAGDDGVAVHKEAMHVNLIAKRTITVDGKLDDWKGALPQTINVTEPGSVTLTEQAWFPFRTFDAALTKGFATGYLAADDTHFYFAAKVADETPDEGTLRFETRDDAQFYYPEVVYQVDDRASLQKRETTNPKLAGSEVALQLPTGTGRSTTYWEDTEMNSAFGVDLELPADRTTQVAVYLPPWGVPSHGISVEIWDTAKNRRLHRQHIRKLWDGTYAVYRLAGKVRVRIQAHGWWFTAKLGGIFFDPADVKPKKPGPACEFVKLDLDTKGNWKGAYGKDGHLVVGCEPKVPAYAKLAVPDILKKAELRWPEGVRRYSYRRYPVLPSGNAPNFDNIQLAFNVLPDEEKPWATHPPGTMPKYIGYYDTDYEYALNKVAAKYGGGVEVWRLRVPGMPHKHFYPRQAPSPFDGPVKQGKLVVTHEGNTRIVECALPWREIPHVKQKLDAGETIKFSFRVNDNAGAGCMELSKGRSVAKRNGAFLVDWTEHWANELEFAIE